MFQDLFNIYLILIGFIGLIFIIVNILLVESNKMDENNGSTNEYIEKSSPFECGFDSFKQSNNPLPVPFIIIALLFLPFDLEITSMLPYIISAYSIGIYGLIIFIIFLFILVIGFIFELNMNAISLSKFIKSSKLNKEIIKYL
uniref:NADH-ubiquinone oxidoreductase chain 3 n=1 Tax=Ogataea polymorpha TaxID=460523 RepID=S5TDT8_9ASCO|nr:NADH dehydrogenase subunit 3 [Ogataea polymorpha]AGS44039.1 NADH dehydrogenase subunit 3 [Ogataea polymorpha]